MARCCWKEPKCWKNPSTIGDEIQFLRVMRRETSSGAERRQDFTWTYGSEKSFSFQALRRFLGMALRCEIIPQFGLPARSAFPLQVRALLVTEFRTQGLAAVRRASRKRKWQALIQALEIGDPERYGARSFWRDWIDSPEVRRRVDRDPVQAHLVTHYPVGNRSRFERIQVVTAYRKAKRFLALLDHWRDGEHARIFRVFTLGMDVPIYVFFHLLCPSGLRRSAAVLTGEMEEVWGDGELLTTATDTATSGK